MSIFYFHIRSASSLIEDLEGSVLPNLAAACTEARMSAHDLLVELIKAELPLDGQCIEVADVDGVVVASVSLKNTITQR